MGSSIEKNAGLSRRGAENVIQNGYWRDLRKILSAPYDKIYNPSGMINLGLAENYLMHTEIADRLKSTFTIDLPNHLTYGQGPVGSPRLLRALASFFNFQFSPIQPVLPSDVLVTAGVAALIDTMTWCICDVSEGILIPQPLYVGFDVDIKMRSRGQLLPVSFLEPGTKYSIDHVFDPEANYRAFQRAYIKNAEQGIKVRAVILSKEMLHLQGYAKYYPQTPQTIREIARFCGEYDLHLISDEIYANSVFINPNEPNTQGFTSALAMDLSDVIHPSRVHIMYGMSKDFCANGMRLGVLQTRNIDLLEAAASINLFAWPAYVTQDLWAQILEDAEFLESFKKTNIERMADSYKRFTSVLQKYHIPYMKGSNAAFYLWIRLIPTRLAESKKNLASYSTVSNAKKVLVDTCKFNGVSIRDGSNYFAEEPEDGWFRVTFTVPDDVLDEAIHRLVNSLKVLGWLDLFETQSTFLS